MAHKGGYIVAFSRERSMKHIASCTRAVALGLLASLLVLAGAARGHTEWTIVDLGDLAGMGSEATSVNNRGEVAGWSWFAATPESVPEKRAFVWRHGAMIDLGVPPGHFETVAEGIIDSGTIVASNNNHGILFFRDGAWTVAPFAGTPNAINDEDTVVGSYDGGNGAARAFMLSDGVFRDLGTIGGTHAVAWSVNNARTVVGFASIPGNDSVFHAFVWKAGVMRDIDGFGGSFSIANDVNNDGVAVGGAFLPDGRFSAFTWDEQLGMRPLFDSPDSSSAQAINNRGTVVGRVGRNGFVFRDGELTRLETLPAVQAAGWTILVPTEISDRDWIVGFGVRQGASAPTAFVLMPK